MNQSDNEEFETRKQEILDNSDDRSNMKDDLFKSIGRANKRDQINDDYRDIFEDQDQDDLNLRDDDLLKFSNLTDTNQPSIFGRIPSLNNEIEIYKKLYDENEEKTILNDRDKTTMTLSDSPTNEIPEIENNEILEKIKSLYVKADWKFIYDQLKEKGYTLRKINDEIGSNFRNNLYTDRSMRISSFNQLRRIFDNEIKYEIMDLHPKKHIRIEKNQTSAELFGIFQSRGNLTTDGKRVVLSFRNTTKLETITEINRMVEEEYDIKGKILQIKDYNAYLINFNSKGFVQKLEEFGLSKGKLSFEDTDIPLWIKENNEFKINYLKGILKSNAKFELNKSMKIKLDLVCKSKPIVDLFRGYFEDNHIKASIRNNRITIRSIDHIIRLTNLANSDTLNEFLADNDLNITVSNLAEKHGLSRNRLFRIPRHKYILQNEAAKLYIEGVSYAEIGQSLEIAKKTIAAWVTRDKILDKFFKNSFDLNKIKSSNLDQIDFHVDSIGVLAKAANLRQSDYILKNQYSVMVSLINFIKANFTKLSFELQNISKTTGLTYNLLKDWLSNSRIIKSLDLSQQDLNLLEKFEEKYVRADWKDLRRIFHKLGITAMQVYKEIGVDIRNQIRNNSLLLYKRFLKIESRYNLDLDGKFQFQFEDKILNSKKDHSMVLPRNKNSAEFAGIMLGDGHTSYEIKISLDANQQLVIDHVDKVTQQLFKEKFQGKREKGTNKWVFRVGKQSFVNGVEGLGIQKGNKTLNQIDIPDWIKENNEFHTPLMKGLVDTDGSVFISKNGLTVNVSNKSVPILDFVEKYCVDNKIPYIRDRNNRPKVEIRRIESVKNFLKIVRPIKLWELNLKKPPQLRKYFPNFPSLD